MLIDPMTQFYRATGDKRYVERCQWWVSKIDRYRPATRTRTSMKSSPTCMPTRPRLSRVTGGRVLDKVLEPGALSATIFLHGVGDCRNAGDVVETRVVTS